MNERETIEERFAALVRVATRGPLALLLALLLAATACEKAKAGKETKAPPPPPAVVVAEVQQRTVPIVRDFVARTEAIPTVEVRARVAAVLEKVLYREGTAVKEGQILFELQRDEYAAALQSAQAQLAKAQADLTRAKDTSIVDAARAQLDERKAELGRRQADVARYLPLAQARAIPQQDLETAQSQEKVALASVEVAAAQLRDSQLAQRTQIELSEAAVQAAKASITQAQLNLGYTRISAPIAGIIGKIVVDPGNLVGKAEPTLLTTISAVDPIYTEFSVAEADYLKLSSRIKIDEQGRGRDTERRLELFLADNSLFPQKGRLIFLGRAFDQKTGTIPVQAEFPNPSMVLRPGQFARVRGTVEQRANAVLVPALAVQEQQGDKVVLVVDAENKVGFRPITVDERVGDLYIVTKGLKAGERVIVEGAQKVRPGMQVKPEQRSSADATAPTPPAAQPEKSLPPAGKGKAGA
ncbi:MAG TPA: efflux RND transporter periplasmic adaptor subunit [Candidatus Methylomirabilis sp.]|nr:efflux RND transporter periplasmic adaptor subunit [Candidatus Methylomirabilis sp.]